MFMDIVSAIIALKRKGYTSRAIAKHIDVSEVSVCRWLSGERLPKVTPEITEALMELFKRGNVEKTRKMVHATKARNPRGKRAKNLQARRDSNH